MGDRYIRPVYIRLIADNHAAGHAAAGAGVHAAVFLTLNGKVIARRGKVRRATACLVDVEPMSSRDQPGHINRYQHSVRPLGQSCRSHGFAPRRLHFRTGPGSYAGRRCSPTSASNQGNQQQDGKHPQENY